MKLTGQLKLALALALVGGALTACEPDYDPNASNTAANASNDMTDGAVTEQDQQSNADNVAETTNDDLSSASTDEDTSVGDSSASASQASDLSISDETDGTPDSGSWNEQAARSGSTDQVNDTVANRGSADMEAATTGQAGKTSEQGMEENAGFGSDREEAIRSDVVAKEQQTVQFNFDSAELTSEAKSKLEDFVDSMEEKDPESVHMVVRGYTDTQGSAEYNQQLAEKRAQAVKDFLVKQGLQSDNLEVKAIGEAQSENIASTIQDNRRVVVEVTVPYAEELTSSQ